MRPAMSTANSGLSPDRLIWLPLFVLMAVALIAGQARANLHAEARAAVAASASFDDPRTAEAWCRMHMDALLGEDAVGVAPGEALEPSSAFGRSLPVSLRLPGGRRWAADAAL